MHYGSLNIQWVTQNYHQERSTQSRIQRKTCTEVQLTQFTQEWQECINWKLILPVHYLCTFLPPSLALSLSLSLSSPSLWTRYWTVWAKPVVQQLRLTKTLSPPPPPPLHDFLCHIVCISRDSSSHALCSSRLGFVFWHFSRPAFDRRGRPLTTQ